MSRRREGHGCFRQLGFVCRSVLVPASLLAAFGTCVQSIRRRYIRHLRLLFFLIKAAWLFSAFGSCIVCIVNCSHGIVAINRIWVFFAVMAAWLFPAFRSCLVRSQFSVAVSRIWVLFAVKAAWLFSAFGSCIVCS